MDPVYKELRDAIVDARNEADYWLNRAGIADTSQRETVQRVRDMLQSSLVALANMDRTKTVEQPEGLTHPDGTPLTHDEAFGVAYTDALLD